MERLTLNIEGNVLIKDADTGEILLSKHNAIHSGNMNYAIASLLAGQRDNEQREGFIFEMAFGDGGTTLDSMGVAIPKSPRIDDISSVLWEETYRKSIHFSLTENSNNNLAVVRETSETHSDIIVNCLLDYNEPESDYSFDEIGLISQQNRLLTHLIFNPIVKTDRQIQVLYTLRITT